MTPDHCPTCGSPLSDGALPLKPEQLLDIAAKPRLWLNDRILCYPPGYSVWHGERQANSVIAKDLLNYPLAQCQEFVRSMGPGWSVKKASDDEPEPEVSNTPYWTDAEVADLQRQINQMQE